MRGGSLKNDEFQFTHVEFRWGLSNLLGSRTFHRQYLVFDGSASYALRNTRYESIDKCYDKPDGIAVLFYLLQPHDNRNIEETVRFINQLATSDGSLKSPINLNISDMKVVELNPVEWFNYDSTPKKLKLTNTGHTVLLSATWQAERPYLRGGPFVGSYTFSQIHFHWGKTDMNGSEHYVDGGSMPMEMHAVHFKSDYKTQEAALRKDDGISILVYFLQLQAAPNPFLDDIIRALPFIQTAHSSVRLIPFPLTNLLRSFQRDYFVYWGSVMLTNIRNSILWLITREPVGISFEQVAKFRTVQNECGAPILTNRQALQDRSGRNIFFVCPSGSTYATLLPSACL